MSHLLFVFTVATSVAAATWNSPQALQMRDRINANGAAGWKAALAPNIPYNDEAALKRLCGAKMNATEWQAKAGPAPEGSAEEAGRRLQSTALPVAYDLRTAYPQCSSIRLIRDQANCGSCWAVSTMNSLSDRHCIKSVKAGAFQERFYAAEDALECCNNGFCGFYNNAGCNGGDPVGAFYWAMRVGVVTGEAYGNLNYCKPYFFSRYNYGYAVAPYCTAQCANTLTYPRTYALDKVKISNWQFFNYYAEPPATTAAKAMQAILEQGTIVAGMDVYSDFYYYRSGVYKKVYGNYLGGHAIRVIGWGRDPVGGDYWIAANSWGTGWGQGGYFWIQRGVNQCRFESYLAAGII